MELFDYLLGVEQRSKDNILYNIVESTFEGRDVIIPRKSASDDTGPFYITTDLFGQVFDVVASV